MRHHTYRRGSKHVGRPGRHAAGPAGASVLVPGDRGRAAVPEAPDRKALQLSHQVAVTLQEVLADCADPVLQSLRVVDVEPAPDASRLLVTLAMDGAPAGRIEPGDVHGHVARAAGHLRSEVASAITRKRAPVLVYRLAAVG